MTVTSCDSTYDAPMARSEDSMFGTPIYARRSRSQDKNNKIFLGAAAVGILAAAGALVFATTAANNDDGAEAFAARQPIAAVPAPRAALATPVSIPVTPGVEPVLQPEAVEPVRTAPVPRAAAAPRARIAEAAAPSATDAGTNVSTREYAPVTPEPAAAPEPAPSPVIISEPPAAEPIPLIAE